MDGAGFPVRMTKWWDRLPGASSISGGFPDLAGNGPEKPGLALL